MAAPNSNSCQDKQENALHLPAHSMERDKGVSERLETASRLENTEIPVSERYPTTSKCPTKYNSAHEYAQAVEQWLWQYQYYNQMNYFYQTFPFYMWGCLSTQQMHTATQLNNHTTRPTTTPSSSQPAVSSIHQQRAAPDAADQRQRNIAAGAAAQPQVPQQGGQGGRVYRVPSLFKRISAEFIDFFLLFMVKLGVTILFVEYVGIVDIQKYDIDYLLTNNLDYNTMFAMTSELVAMEVINRIFICIFETLCLCRGIAGRVGGTTPGKRMMGLKVVSCEEISDVARGWVRVAPSQDIGFWNALVRSVIKNFSLAFFFPVCFTVFFFQHNRAAYDIISNCVVVESQEEDV